MNKISKEVEVFVTDEYDRFKTHWLQPDKRKGAGLALIDSLKDSGGNKYGPILVTVDGFIIDGHRRLAALITAGLPVHYIVVGMEDTAKFMLWINTTAANWSTLQMVNHHGKQNESYAELEEWLGQKGATLQLLVLFGGRTYPQLRKGAHLNFNYDDLEQIRRASLLVAGTFGLTQTLAARAINKVQKKIKTLSINVLMARIERDRKAGKYDNVVFAANADKLATILLKTYRKAK